MKINSISPYSYNYRFTSNATEENDEAKLIVNDGTMKYDADICLSKTDSHGNTLNEYFKDGKYIIHETVSPLKRVCHPFKTVCQDVDVFVRNKGEKITKRRYKDGTEDVLIKGSWNSTRGYEIEHLDKDGNTKGFTRREYIDSESDNPYWDYDYYCMGNVRFRYIQTRFDKDHKPIGSFEGLEIVTGKRTKSL